MGILDFVPLIGAVSNVVGGAADYLANEHATKVNQANVRETNEMNYKIHREDMAYQTGEREATQAYNSPSAQRQRFESAGINPYMAIGQIEGGNATAQSAPSPPDMKALQVQPNSLRGIIDGVASSFQQAQLVKENIDGVRLDNDAKRTKLVTQLTEQLLGLEKQRADIANTKQMTAESRKRLEELDGRIGLIKEELDIVRSTKNDRKLQSQLQTQQMRLENKARDLANAFQEWSNDFAKKEGAKKLEVMQSVIASNLANANLANKQAALAAYEKVVMQAQKAGIDLDNQQKKMLRGHILTMARLQEQAIQVDNTYKDYMTGLNGRDWLNMFSSTLNTAIGVGAGYMAGKSRVPSNVQSVKAVPATPTIYY